MHKWQLSPWGEKNQRQRACSIPDYCWCLLWKVAIYTPEHPSQMTWYTHSLYLEICSWRMSESREMARSCRKEICLSLNRNTFQWTLPVQILYSRDDRNECFMCFRLAMTCGKKQMPCSPTFNAISSAYTLCTHSFVPRPPHTPTLAALCLQLFDTPQTFMSTFWCYSPPHTFWPITLIFRGWRSTCCCCLCAGNLWHL